MKAIHVAQMKWCEREEPICAGTNKRKIIAEALQILREEHGTGPVMCGMPIVANDIEVVTIPFVSSKKGLA